MDPECLPAPLQCCVIMCTAFMAHLAPDELITEGVGGTSAGLQYKHCWINLAQEMHSHPGERNVRAGR